MILASLKPVIHPSWHYESPRSAGFAANWFVALDDLRYTIYEMIRRGDFPRQVQLGRRAVGWIADDVVEWIYSKVDSRAPNSLTDTV